jgi:uncharacterized protein (UPF0332 family)
MNEKDRKLIATYWLEKAESSLQCAKDDAAAKRYAFAISRLYYAVFYAVSAALAAEGTEYGKHSAVRSAFNLHYVKAKKVSEEVGDLYNVLYDERNESDYKPFVAFDIEDVQPKIEAAERFIETFRQIVHKMLQ